MYKSMRCLCLVAVMILLVGCGGVPKTGERKLTWEEPEQGSYELTFTVELLSGGTSCDWGFAYACNGEAIASGDRILFPMGCFSFYSVRVEAIERDARGNRFSAAFPVAICDGGSGKTEITVTDRFGNRSVFRISCQVTQVGKQ